MFSLCNQPITFAPITFIRNFATDDYHTKWNRNGLKDKLKATSTLRLRKKLARMSPEEIFDMEL